MKQVELGNTGEKVSEVCLGAMLMGTAMDKETSFRVLDHFVDAGGNYIDTANCYCWWLGKGEFVGGESESLLGEWMKSRKNRDKIVLATKVGGRIRDPYHIRDANGVPEWHRVRDEYEGLSAANIKQEIENSLRRLQVDYIDLYYTHVFDPHTPLVETMTAMDSLVKEGKVRFIGASNLTTGQLKEANTIAAKNKLTPYTALQQEYSFIHPVHKTENGIVSHADQTMFEYLENNSMAFMAYSPLIKGIYSSKEKRYQYYDWSLFDSEDNIRKLDLVDDLAKKLGITGNQLVLAWMLRQNPRIIPILGFSKMEHYLEDVKACEIELPEDILRIMG